ncbi:hypothetical protein MHLP_04570 [Candidatus Mycoplasma haematolamae str. Purdue]|uniref:Ribonuclease J C-terminal domain-containing protein n=1 Tax=Mycoplasma haematolamae (strain Purdue) TaxID=1212765 RepID=I7CKW3_MYCHA|nr:ribonuclease J [Candidatus Mycoplasma haematolamae]AFO52494.1 hypothetical protein MHLP_04570 [Candidatus Mycoplasma haematolamae str. Purdue]
MIKYYSLGGQDERFRYCGVLDINGEVFLLNAGGSCVNTNLYDVEEIIPNYQHLVPIQKKIKGLFIGVPKELNICSIPYLLDVFPELPIYTNSFGESVIRSFLKRFESVKGKKYAPNIVALNLVSEHSISSECKVMPIKVAASLPNSLAWAFRFSNSDHVVFIDEFLVASENLPCRENQLNVLFQNLKSKVSLLIVGTQSVSTVPSFALKQADNYSYLKKIVSRISSRLVVAIYLDDWHTLFNLSRIAYVYDSELCIYPSELSERFNSFLEQNKLREYSPSVSPENAQGPKEDRIQICVITGTHNTLYENLRKIQRGEEESLKISNKDVVIFMNYTFIEKEPEEISVINDLAQQGGEVLKVPSTFAPYMAGSEDLMLLVNYLMPYNVVPVNGFYKDYVEFTKSMENVMNTKKIFFLENGQCLHLDRKSSSVEDNTIPEIYVGGQEILDINRITLYERKLLAQSGVILVSLRCNSKKNLISVPKVQLLNVFAKDYLKTEEAIEEIQSKLKIDLSKYLQFNPEMDNKTLKQTVRKSIYNSLDQFMHKKPAVLSIVSHLS